MNLYVHFPFCRSKCAYCALHSYVGRTEEERRSYVAGLIRQLDRLFRTVDDTHVSTLYFGGGTPTLCDLQPLFDFLAPHLIPPSTNPQPEPHWDNGRPARCNPQPEPYWDNGRPARCNPQRPTEFTVELNPLDVTPERLRQLKAGGVNRLSMGVQILDDAVLRSMGRPHTAAQACAAWRMIRDAGFGNAGIDLICGWPGERREGPVSDPWRRTLEAAAALAPDHCSVYTLILEPQTRLALDVEKGRTVLPSDDAALAELAAAEEALAAIGLERYEISSFARPGKECRHNLATWRGEDYIGIGDGACSREGSAVSRVIFRLRLLKEGFNPCQAAEDFPELAPRVAEWCATLNRFAAEGLLNPQPSTLNSRPSTTYRLTPRGTEVCDTILAELV